MNRPHDKKNKKHRSLRSVLLIWFILFSIVPLAFIGWYSIFKFAKAFDQEVIQRLQGNGREVDTILNDYYSTLDNYKEKYINNAQFIQLLLSTDVDRLNNLSLEWILRSPVTSLSFYDKEGKLITTSFRDEKGQVRNFSLNKEKIVLNSKYISNLNERNEIGFLDQKNSKVSLILFSKALTAQGSTAGYFEQVIELRETFLLKLKSRLKTELFIMNESREIVLSSRPEFKNIQVKILNMSDENFIDYELLGQKYGFVLYPVIWDRSKFYIGIGAIKKDTQAILKNFNVAFVSVVSLMSLFLVMTILITTNLFLKPVERLIRALKIFEKNEKLIQLPVTTNTEIGILTEAFNEMSYKVYQVRLDLKKKIKELEKINSELIEAQTKLVHSAKMTSLGQLVAGVAHELNNPIGFIYSNMSLLKEYADSLFLFIDQQNQNDPKIIAIKKQIDYEFIKMDLPRLIKSCQDGAQRTRDIVIGLRNFSRLEEAQLKEIDIHESIDTTLEILQGEIKNRIQVHRQYEKLPKLMCYASQINQVLMNIISNAIQAISGSGQIWITTSSVKPKIDAPAKIQISIQDSGAGMDATTIDKIFEPFFTTKGVGQGTGLGLSISYGIVQNHGGEIQVRSEKGVGTEFMIILPLKPNTQFKA